MKSTFVACLSKNLLFLIMFFLLFIFNGTYSLIIYYKKRKHRPKGYGFSEKRMKKQQKCHISHKKCIKKTKKHYFCNRKDSAMHKKDVFDRVFRQNYRHLYVFAYRIVGNEEESCDLVHDCFEELWNNFHETDENVIKAFLYTCLRRKCIDTLRHRQAQQRYIRLTAAVTNQWGGYYDVSISELEARERQISECINMLQPPTKEIFVLCYVEHKKYAEAAEILGLSVSTIKKHIVRALRFFRERRENAEQ